MYAMVDKRLFLCYTVKNDDCPKQKEGFKMIRCPYCGAENEESFTFCRKCAKQLPVFDYKEDKDTLPTKKAELKEAEENAGDNIGRYIVNSATILGFLSVVSALILLVIDLMEGDPSALLDFVWGGIGVICSFALYGFGILVDDIHEIKNHITSKK